METRISIGLQSGGPDNSFMWPKVHLVKMLEKHCARNYAESVDHFALVLRVSGAFDDFGSEAIERIRLARVQRTISADIVVPEDRWRGLTETGLKAYLAQQVRAALESCVAKQRKAKLPIEGTALLRDVDRGIAEFLATATPRAPWTA